MPQSFRMSFTRPANTTQYATGDLVANSATNTLVSFLNFGNLDGVLEEVRLRKTGSGIVDATFRLHLWAVPEGLGPLALSVTNGDNGVLQFNTWEHFLGRLEANTMLAAPGASGAWTTLLPMDTARYLLTGQRIYGLLEARGPYTPASNEEFFFAGATA
jgi:hypothetical protein